MKRLYLLNKIVQDRCLETHTRLYHTILWPMQHHLIVLHGALGAADQFSLLSAALEQQFVVHRFNFYGHGGSPIPGEPLSIPLFAAQIGEYIQQHQLNNVVLAGYSMGGYAAVYFANQHPQKVKAVITLATKFHWDPAIAAREIKMLDAATIEQKVPAFARQLAQRHTPVDWKLLLVKTAEMMQHLGAANPLQLTDYAAINTPALILLGDRDKMVTLDETVAVFKQLPNAQLGILPGTQHPIEQVDTALLSALVLRFLQSVAQ